MISFRFLRLVKSLGFYNLMLYMPSSLGKFNCRFPHLKGLYFFGSNVFENIRNIIVKYQKLEAMGYEDLCEDLYIALLDLNCIRG